jgi:hypothetical protein
MRNMLGSAEHELDVALAARAAAVARRAPLVDELLREPRPIAVMRDVDEWGVSLLAAVLVDEFRRRPPGRGELVAVRYDGRPRPRLAETLVDRYRLFVDRGP